MVYEPWPVPYLLVPRNSTVEMYCTANRDSTFWSVDLANDTSNIQYRNGDKEWITHSVYELPRMQNTDMLPVLRLLINDTGVNNQTEIFCNNRHLLATTLFVYGKQTTI